MKAAAKRRLCQILKKRRPEKVAAARQRTLDALGLM